MRGVNYSVSDVRHALQSAMTGGSIQQGANLGRNVPLNCLSRWIEGRLFNAQPERDFLDQQSAQIVGNIVCTKPGPNKEYQCQVWFNHRNFFISQSPTGIVISDPNTKETATIEDLTFPDLQEKLLAWYVVQESGHLDLTLFNPGTVRLTLFANLPLKTGQDFCLILKKYFESKPCLGSSHDKAKILRRYLDTERNAGNVPVDLSLFDLSDVNFKEIDLTGALVSEDNLEAIIAANGNLSGAQLAPGTVAPKIYCLDKFGVDKNMAIQLINAGANQRAVLLNYLATERQLQRSAIDVSGMDLSQVDRASVDLTNVSNVDAIKFAETRVDPKRQITILKKDLLLMLSIFSKTGYSVIKQSGTRDVSAMDRDTAWKISVDVVGKRDPHQVDMENLPPDLVDYEENIRRYVHHAPVVRYVQRHYVPQSCGVEDVRQVIKTSTGDCGETAQLGLTLLKLYLIESLNLLGYQGFKIDEIHLKSAFRPSVHHLAVLKCSFQGNDLGEYMVDPWKGRAWTYDDGQHYFATTPDAFIQPGVWFNYNYAFDYLLRSDGYRSKAHDLFVRSGAKEQLDCAIRASKSEFQQC